MYTQYSREALVTENSDYSIPASRLLESGVIRLLHAVIGISNESGELSEILKKYIYYGANIDKIHLIEEFGDILWYLNLGAVSIGSSLEEVMALNIAKLRKRYPEGKFSENSAINRDCALEKLVMEEIAKINSDGGWEDCSSPINGDILDTTLPLRDYPVYKDL